MNREILYRSWYKSLNRFFYFKNGYYYSDEECKCSTDKVWFDWSNAQQFTGKTDKNGKKIFEGDDVECLMSYKDGSLPHRGIIVYNNEFGAFATKNEAGETLLHNHLLNTFEIIDHIYEEETNHGV
jgi:uncharacterized phage protein (TIGR01671 family)